MEEATTISLKNPITGNPVDEVISEKEGRKRGYFELEFILKHLEDDNEFVKYFIVAGKSIIVQLEKPYLNYKKPTQVNHERVLNGLDIVQLKPVETVAAASCNMDEGCVSCGS